MLENYIMIYSKNKIKSHFFIDQDILCKQSTGKNSLKIYQESSEMDIRHSCPLIISNESTNSGKKKKKLSFKILEASSFNN